VVDVHAVQRMETLTAPGVAGEREENTLMSIISVDESNAQ
jgi:hypothetical protein